MGSGFYFINRENSTVFEKEIREFGNIISSDQLLYCVQTRKTVMKIPYINRMVIYNNLTSYK